MKVKTGKWLRQILSCFSIFATLPALFVSHVLKARAEEAKKPETNVAGLTARLRARLNRNRSNLELLKRQSAFRLPHQKGNYVMVYKKQADGSWKIVADTAIPEAPAAPATK